MRDVAWALALAIALIVACWPAEPLLLAPEPGRLSLRRWRLVNDGLGDHNTDPESWVTVLRQSRGLVPGSVAVRSARPPRRGAHRATRRLDLPPPRPPMPPPPDPYSHFVPAQDEEAQRRAIEAWAGQYVPRPVETVWLTEDNDLVPVPPRTAPPPVPGWDVHYDGPVTRGPDHDPAPPADDPPTVIRGLRAVMADEMPPLPGYPED